MLTSVMHLHGALTGLLIAAEEGGHSEAEPGPGPIIPDLNELYWALGSFVVFALLMRFFLFPRLKKGMDARYASIRGAHEQADATRAAARAEVADYEAQLATVKAEAATRIDAARQTLEAERQAAISALTARLDERRAVAKAEAEAAREAVHEHIRDAVVDVAGRAGELATGKKPDPAVVARVVSEVMAR